MTKCVTSVCLILCKQLGNQSEFLRLLHPSDLSSVSMDLPILGIYYKYNHTTCVLLHLISYT